MKTNLVDPIFKNSLEFGKMVVVIPKANFTGTLKIYIDEAIPSKLKSQISFDPAEIQVEIIIET